MEKEYLILIPVDPIPDGFTCERGKSLPLHCTVIPWFSFKKEPQIPLLIEYLKKIELIEEIYLVSKERVFFDPDATIPVYVLEQNDALHFLHAKLLLFLFQIGASLEGKINIIAKRYRPHVSDHEGKTFPPKSQHHATELVLIEKDATCKRVLGRYIISNPF